MMFEQGERQTLHAEADTSGMSRFSGGRPYPPQGAEMVLMVVEALTSGRLLGAFDRHEQLEFQTKFALVEAITRPPRPKNGSLATSIVMRQAEFSREFPASGQPFLAETP